MPSEKWVAVVGYEGRYEVSSHGRIRSLCYRWRRGRPPQIMKQARNAKGYPCVTLRRPNDQKQRRVMHRLVLNAFVGPCPQGHEASHLDGTRTNNRVTNLAWMTPSENNALKKKHGTYNSGERNPFSKMTWPTVRKARKLRFGGWNYPRIAALFDVSPSCIELICKGKTWKESA